MTETNLGIPTEMSKTQDFPYSTPNSYVQINLV